MKVNITIGIPAWLDKMCAWPVTWYRKRRFGYSYRRIYLGEGEWTIVEPADYYLLRNYNWHLGGNNKEFYAIRSAKIAQGKIKIISMHRQIMNFPEGRVVDHRNNTPLDNRRSNLRSATQSENHQNARKRKNTSSQFTGVSFDKRHENWSAYINYRGKKIFLGYYDKEIDAARAYDHAALKYYGEFARLNFPREDYANEIL